MTEFELQNIRRLCRSRKEKINELKDKPCVDCGNTFPAVCMDFDHRPGETKLFTIASGYRKSWDTVEAEIAKCDIVCANCHRLRTHSRLVLKPTRIPGGKGPIVDPIKYRCGHPRTEANTLTQGTGSKRCKLCVKAKDQRRKLAKLRGD